MNYKKWLVCFGICFFLLCLLISMTVVFVDPYMHYHKPNPQLFYNLASGEQRYLNNGIIKHFDYDGILTGTSMAENFKTSEAEELFDARFIKVPFSGGMFKEIDENIRTALEAHEVKYVIRPLDTYKINADKDESAYLPEELPQYLYDNNPLNDAAYWFDADILSEKCIPMISKSLDGVKGGVTSFDAYSNWNDFCEYGESAVLNSFELSDTAADVQEPLTEEDIRRIRDNIKQNVTNLADAYPNTEFYYFYPPYSMAYWGILKHDGQLLREVEAIRCASQEILKHPNIKLFCFGDRIDLLSDFDHYKDDHHYDEDVNSWILQKLYAEEGILREDTVQAYFDELYETYDSYDYSFLY